MNPALFECTTRTRGSPACLLGIALLATLIVPAGPVQAADLHHTVVAAGDIKWGPAPPSLPPGAQAAMLLGSPAKEGPFAFRLKFPPGFVIPPHRHSKDELVTVIAGSFGVGTGEKLDRASVQPLAAQSFVQLPAGMPHYAVIDGETIVQVNGVGPFDVVYIDPKDDPRKQ